MCYTKAQSHALNFIEEGRGKGDWYYREKVEKVIDWFKKSPLESAITVKETRNFFWKNDARPVNFKPNDRLSTTSGPFLWEATHSLVMYKRSYMLENWELFPNTFSDPYPYLLKSLSSNGVC